MTIIMLIDCLISALPVVLLIGLMLILKVRSHLSALITLAATIAAALFVTTPLGITESGQPAELIVVNALGEGIAKALFPILTIIIMALFSYNILLASGDIEIIKSHLSTFGTHRSLLVLLLTWGFGGLLEGIAGFGTAVAIPAAILTGLGFNPVFSALVSLISNTVFTDFGAVGITLYTLVTEFTGSSPDSATMMEFSKLILFQFIPAFFIIPFTILSITDKKLTRRNLFNAFVVGVAGIMTQYLCVRFLGYETPSIIASLVSMVVIVLLSGHYSPHRKGMLKSPHSRNSNHSYRELLRAWSVYIFIISLILLTGGVIPTLRQFLSTHYVSELHFRATETTFRIAWLGNASLWIFAGSLVGGLIQGLTLKQIVEVFLKTLHSLRFSIVTIICLICIAGLMGHTGMTVTLAAGIVSVAGNSYPFFAPMVGALGTFITGSNTSSQILFGKLQANAATVLSLKGEAAAWLGTSNISGGSAGKIISPQSIAIASASCGLTGEDDKILRKALPYALVYLLIISAIVFAGMQVFE